MDQVESERWMPISWDESEWGLIISVEEFPTILLLMMISPEVFKQTSLVEIRISSAY